MFNAMALMEQVQCISVLVVVMMPPAQSKVKEKSEISSKGDCSSVQAKAVHPVMTGA